MKITTMYPYTKRTCVEVIERKYSGEYDAYIAMGKYIWKATVKDYIYYCNCVLNRYNRNITKEHTINNKSTLLIYSDSNAGIKNIEEWVTNPESNFECLMFGQLSRESAIKKLKKIKNYYLSLKGDVL